MFAFSQINRDKFFFVNMGGSNYGDKVKCLSDYVLSHHENSVIIWAYNDEVYDKIFTKSAVCALAKNLVKEFEGTGTTVNAIIPGFVAILWQKEKPEESKQNYYRKTAIYRFASVEEVVDAYRFCIENPFVNGSLIEVNGGYCYK